MVLFGREPQPLAIRVSGSAPRWQLRARVDPRSAPQAPQRRRGRRPEAFLRHVKGSAAYFEIAAPYKAAFDELRAGCGCLPNELFAVLKRMDLVLGPGRDSFHAVVAHEHLTFVPGCGELTRNELDGWLDRLIAEHRWGPAYLTWVASLDPAQRDSIGNVFNGSFETEPLPMGFDWRFGRAPGARISREQVTGASGSLALHVAFEDRRIPFQDVRQLLALAPGGYRFSGRSRLDQLRTERGLIWRLTCAEDNRVIAETEPFAGNHGWRAFEQSVTVPADNCGAQWLTLLLPARIPAEQRIGGAAWFDALEMERISPN